MSLLEFLGKESAILENSGLTSHDCRGFQLTPNRIEFEIKGYGESYNIKILPMRTFYLTLIFFNFVWG